MLEKKRASRWQDPVPPGAPGAPVLGPPKVVIPTDLSTPPTAIPSTSTAADLAAAVAAAPDTTSTTARPSSTTSQQQPPHSGAGPAGPGCMPGSSGPPMPLAVAASILSAAGLCPHQGGPPRGLPASGANNTRPQGMPPPPAAALAAMFSAANLRPQGPGGGMPPAMANLLAAATGMRPPLSSANAGYPPGGGGGGGGGGGPGMNGGMPMMLNAAMSLLNRFQPATPPTAPPPGMEFGPGAGRRGCGPPGGVNNPAVQRVLQRLPQRPNQPRPMMSPRFNFMEVATAALASGLRMFMHQGGPGAPPQGTEDTQTPDTEDSNKRKEPDSDDEFVPYVPVRKRKKQELNQLKKRVQKHMDVATRLAEGEEESGEGEEEEEEEEEPPEEQGPKALVSLLDQHTELKKKEEARKETAKEKMLKAEQELLESVTENKALKGVGELAHGIVYTEPVKTCF